MKHVAIIPDGNRRWAKEHGLPSFEGHRRGADKVLPALIEKAAELGIEYFTFWVMSTENLTKRSQDEVNQLFSLCRFFIRTKVNEMYKKGARIKAMGNIDGMPEDIRDGMYSAIEKTKDNTKITVVFAVNYGGRDEIIRAVHKIKNSGKEIDDITKENFGTFLDTAGIPDPDLIIRTGGDKRLSGFMLWQSEYSESMFVDTYYPDFGPAEFEQCIAEFNTRQRRFGK